MRGDVSFQLRGAKRIAQLVQRSARDLEEPRELLVLARESFSDVAAHRIRCIFRLRSKFEIAREALLLRQLEHQDPYLIGELPDNQILVASRSTHVLWKSTLCASSISSGFESATTKPSKIRDVSAPQSAHLLHRPGFSLHRPGFSLHRPGSTLHRLGSTLHRIGSTLHRPGSTLHRLGSTLHRPGSTSHRPAYANHF